MTHDELVEALEDHRDLWLRWTTNPTVPMVDIHALADLVLDTLETPTEEEPKRWTVNANPTPAGDPAIVLDDLLNGRIHPVRLPTNDGNVGVPYDVILRDGVVDVLRCSGRKHTATFPTASDWPTLLAHVRVPPLRGRLEDHMILPGPNTQLAE